MVFSHPPVDFYPAIEVASSICEYKGKILLLLRQEGKEQAGTWCLPGGKKQTEETVEVAAARELQEESGIQVVRNELQFFRTLFVRYPTYDFTYTLFHLPLKAEPPVQLSFGEHTESTWVTPVEALKLPLILDLDVCLKIFYHL